MTNTYKHLQVLGYLRKVYDWDAHDVRFPTGEVELVVRVVDEGGPIAWEITADGDRLTSITTIGRDLDHRAVHAVPVRDLRAIAAIFVRRLDEDYSEPGAHLDDSLELAAALTLSAFEKGSSVQLEDFAEAWGKTPQAGRRQALAKHFYVSLPTVDRWTRAARDQGLLAPPANGRPRASTPPPTGSLGPATTERSDA